MLMKIMSSRSKYAAKYLKFHKSYEKRATTEIMKTFNKWIKDIKWGELQAGSYKSIINTTFNINDMISSYIRIYTEIGKVHGKRVAKDLKLELKLSIIEKFLILFEMNVSQFLRTFGLQRITQVRKSFFEMVVNAMETRLEKGLSMREAVNEVMKDVNNPKFYRWMAERIARTESTAASNYSATQVGEVSGFVMVKHWISTRDPRTRRPPESIFNHLAMDGTKVKLNEKFIFNNGLDALSFPGDPEGMPGNTINCYLPNTIISSNIVEGQKSFYSGEVVEIVTSRGERLTITPNHGILTEQGFIRAKDINIGDDLICNSLNTNPVFRLVNNYIKKKMFTAQNIFSTLEKFWLSKQLMVTGLDFDTDGNSMNGYINIVYPKVKLRNRIVTKFFEYINKFNLKATNSQRVVIASNGTFNLFSRTNKAAFRRLMSFLYLAFPSLFRHLRPFKRFGFGLAAHINTKRDETSAQSDSRNTGFLRELINTDTRLIAFDKVINVRNIEFTGHVYDFTSYNGVNIANNIYTSNCRCAVAVAPLRDKKGRLIRIE